ncbi:uncharacterized protein LOC126899824 isoform X2 [Daktulosphaira vitifoliae]|uniref:uncharacterized protein LOC126899824 isoform X1 n=1 Tax=Daktulosphaira vitifoliae TaxID=58002 RepID=UPI0021A986FB|nr:uncharacterized protein LOC126899824 isoform X1 [Daktulosphaira vitifoliae]XP_050531007.1 uncharacterized protein LOC126899824 isoform X2 [Daktulosphaira vitifoliae]
MILCFILDNMTIANSVGQVEFQRKNDLLNCLVYSLNEKQKFFITIGIEPREPFNTEVRIISPLKNVSISIDFLKRIFGSMGNILSSVLTAPIKKENILLLEDVETAVWKRAHRKTNVILIKSKIYPKCQVVFKYEHLITLLDLEYVIFDAINRQNTVNRPIIKKQFEEIIDYCFNIFTHERITNDYNAITLFVKNIDFTEVGKHIMKKHDHSYAHEIKTFMSTSIVDRLADKKTWYNTPQKKNEHVREFGWMSLVKSINEEPCTQSPSNYY